MVPLPDDPLSEATPVAANLFAIAVGHVTLDEPVSRYSSSRSIRGFNGRVYSSSDDIRHVMVAGMFNNLLIYDARTGATKKVFNKRISITSFMMPRSRSPRSLLITVAERDSNKDGKLDEMDLEQLYAYTLEDGQLRQVQGLVGSPEGVIDLRRDDHVVVRTVVDDDNDGSKKAWGLYDEEEPEPRRLFRLDLKTFVATPLIAESLTAELQAIVDAAPPPPVTN
jgi:hypothetical protein